MTRTWAVFLLAGCLPLLACADDSSSGGSDAGPGGASTGGPASACAPADPDRYPSAGYQSNAIIELGIRAAHEAFMLPMRMAGSDGTSKPTATQLKALFDSGPPSLRSITTPYFAARIDGWLALFEASAGNSWTPAEPPPATGGKLGVDIYSKEGLDIRQAIDKGMFSAAFYNHAVKLMNGPVTPATIDRILALFGTHPSFSMGDAGAGSVDIWAAVYARRRTNPNASSPGLYRRIQRNLIAAQAAAGGGADCQDELQTALRAIREDWERTLLATTLFYANDAKTKLGMLNVAGALHSLGEGLGFAHGFRMMPAENRRITDAQIDEILTLLGAPPDGPVTLYRFATDTAAQAPRLDEVVAKVQMVYGFSDAEVASFKNAY